LPTGHWLLVTGCWLLDTGYWPLYTGQGPTAVPKSKPASIAGFRVLR